MTVGYLGQSRRDYLAEAGFSLSLPPTYPWVRRGESRGVPRAWGGQGRLNVVGHLTWDGERWGLFFRLVFGPVRSGEVRAYLQGVAEGLERPMKVFLDNAAFHRGEGIREALGGWAERGLSVGYLPRYSPHWNPMEGVWRRVKGFLMPRRHYRNLAELADAVRLALKALGGVELVFQGEGT